MDEIEELVKDLQQKLAQIDHKQKRHSRNFEIPIHKIERLTVRMQPDHNHQRPHLHVDYGKQRHIASFALNNAEMLAGKLPPKEEKVISDWILKHSDILSQIWISLQMGEDAKPLIIELQGDS